MKRTKVIRINGVEYIFESSGTGTNINIVDNLETTDVNSALSANQGKVLNDKVELLKSETMVPEYNEETETLKLNFKVPTQGVIEDTLESDNANNALSAKQGKVLNEKIDNVQLQLNLSKSVYRAVGFATGSDSMTLLADTVTKIGTISIPPKCVATLMLRANNRNVNPNIIFGISNDEAVTTVGWGATHSNVTQYHSTSDTWIHQNNTNNEMTIYVFAKSSIAINLMYVSIQAVCIPIS